jgi:hypothetical protein
VYVYHYCDLKTFHSIVTEQRLHLSNIRFMNDYAEVRGFLNIVANVVAEREVTAEAGEGPFLSEMLDGLNRWIQSGEFEHVYCACFSRDGDELGQWRAYGDDGCGVAIGFDKEELLKEINKQLPEDHMGNLRWRKVLYEESEQRELATQTVSDVFDAADYVSQSSDAPEHVQDLFRRGVTDLMLQTDITAAGAQCKHLAFRSEKEERLVFAASLRVGGGAKQRITHPHLYLPAGFELKAKTRRSVVVPFLEVKAPRTAIRQIIRGPCFGGGPGSFGEEAKEAIEMFLNYLYEGDSQPPIFEDSIITYRSGKS